MSEIMTKKEQLSAARQRSLSTKRLLFGNKQCYEYKNKQGLLFISRVTNIFVLKI